MMANHTNQIIFDFFRNTILPMQPWTHIKIDKWKCHLKKNLKNIFLKICPWKIAKKKLTQNFILYLTADFRTKCKFMPESFQMDT